MNYLFAAYVAIWCILFFYFYSLKARQRGLEETVEVILKRLETSGK